MRSPDLQRPRHRVRIAGLLMLVPFFVLAARAAHLSVIDRRGVERGDAQTRRVITLMPERGIIVDRNGVELALSIDAPSVYAVPSELPEIDPGARHLAAVLGSDAAGLARRMRGHPSFLFVERWIDPEQAERVKALDLPGVGVLEEPRRVYPHKGLAAKLVGFANIDGNGVRGIEQQEDEWLRGSVRHIPVERDARGALLAEGDLRSFRTAGGDVALTIDMALQADAATALRRAVERLGARGGIVISLDPHSGDVLALAESPSFDPNRFREVDYRDTRSRAFLDAVEPGSTFKAFLVAAALEHGSVRPGELIDCEDGEFQVPGKVVHDARPHGELSVAGILRVSSNIGAVKLAYGLGPQRHFDTLRGFGFGRSTGSGFPEESAGLLRDWHHWRPLDHATIAFGQGVSVTPIQLAAATAALANRGVWRAPRLVAARRAAGGAWLPTRPGPANRAVRAETAARVLAMLEGVTGKRGTGHRAALRGVRVAGKTGTAQKLDRETGHYAEHRFIAWFVGVVPADDPVLAIAVALDEPRHPYHTGGGAAAPLFAEVAAAQLARFGIVTAPLSAPAPAPAPTRVAEAPRVPDVAAGPSGARVARRAAEPDPEPPARPLPELARLHDRVLLPDFRGLTVAEVRHITERNRVDLEISGRGRAVSQEPPPGSVVAVRETRVRVRFEEPRARHGGKS